jgi:Tol biopolymer transport system component
MAPEQVRGLPADSRSDIFAFGAVLYEMLSGRGTFARESPAETMTAIARENPAALESPLGPIPPWLERIVIRCLEKDPAARFQSAHDLAFALESASGESGVRDIGSADHARSPAAWRVRILRPAVWLLIGLLLGAAGARRFFSQPATDSRVIRASIGLPAGLAFHLAAGNPGPVVICPDGTKLAFTAFEKGQIRIYVRDLQSPSVRAIPGTEGAQYPFWSADNRSLGFFAGQKLKTIDLAGGLPVVLADAVDGKGGAWSRDGVILFAPDANQSIHRIASSGGTAAPVTRVSPDAGENSHRQPEFLPDGRHFLFAVRGDATAGTSARHGGSIRIASLDGGDNRLLTPADSNAIYASGHLLYIEAGTSRLVARPFDTTALGWSGDPVLLADDVMVLRGAMRGVFGASQNGVLAFFDNGQGAQHLTWFDRSGAAAGVATALEDLNFRVSPDGRRIVFEDLGLGGAEDLWMLDVSRGVRSRLTAELAPDLSPVWSPDGRSVIFTSKRNGPADIYWKSAAGGDDVLLFASSAEKAVTSWSRDGRYVAFYTTGATDRGVWILPLDGSSPPKPGTPFRVVQSGAFDWSGEFSPDGRWLAYASRESGTDEVFVTPSPSGGAKWQVSSGGGAHPRWRADGREIFYLTAAGELVAVSVTPQGADLAFGTPASLFHTHRPMDANTPFEVLDDGKRFLVLSSGEQGSARLLTLVTNWTRQLATRGER